MEQKKMSPLMAVGLDTNIEIKLWNSLHLDQIIKAEKIIFHTCNYLNHEMKFLTSFSKNGEVTKTRIACIYMLKRETWLSDQEIACLLGRERTTIMYHYFTLNDEMKVNKTKRCEIGRLAEYVLNQMNGS